jgi:poly(3-hydroxybutyrate) depolymerase
MKHSRIFTAIFLLGFSFSALASEAEFTSVKLDRRGKYSLVLPSSPLTKNTRLLVYFHGAGAGPHYDSQMNELTRAADAYKMALLMIQAPNGTLSWAEPGPGSALRHVDYVNSLLEDKVYSVHQELSRQRTVFVGWSAGSTFISGDFLPSKVNKYQGGAILLCGGGPPVLPTLPENSLPISAQTKAGFKVFYYIHGGDFLARQTMEGVVYWRDRGLAVGGEHPRGAGHCAFDLSKTLDRGLRYVLGAP